MRNGLRPFAAALLGVLIGSSWGCVSKPNVSSSPAEVSDSKQPLVPISASESSTGKPMTSLPRSAKVFERRSSFHDRMRELASPSSQPDSTSEVSDPSLSQHQKSASQELSSAALQSDGTALLVRSERWTELLKETQGDWNRCESSGQLGSDKCRLLGRARGSAYAKLGHLREAMKIYDSLASRGVSSTDALVFAGLLADAGSVRLCWQLAGSGLQWEPADDRLELFSLQAKCLRQDGLAEKARDAITRGLGEYPENPKLLLESAHLFLSEKKLTQGCILLERLYLQEFRDVAVFFNWGHCLVGRRDAAAARIVLEQAQREFPSERLWILLSGEVALLEGNLNGARRDGLDFLANSEAGDVFRLRAESLIRSAQGE